MPMNVLTLLQTISIFGAYLFVSVGLPAFTFGRKLKEHRMLERFLLYYTIGNFYIINLVYILELVKISYPATLTLGTFVPAILGRWRLNRTPVRRIVEDRMEDLKKLTRGSMGRRTALLRIRKAAGRKLRALGRYLWRTFRDHPVDCLLGLGLLGLLCCLQGTNLLEIYGYKAFDIPVHNYWINAMCENRIFVAGVYPHGLHCVIYYLHSLFGFPVFEILRVFGFIESVMVHMTLLVFLKLCCKSRYAPYVGVFLYAGSSYFLPGTYWRFHAVLPQEFGMLFILPPIYFGFAYFAARERELAEEKKPGEKRSLWQKLRPARGKKAKDPPEAAAGDLPSGLTEAAAVPGDLASGMREAAVTGGLPPEGREADLAFERAETPARETALADPPPEEEPEKSAPVEPVPKEADVPRRRKRLRKKGLRRFGKPRLRASHLHLAGFAMSFSMCFTVHFYGAFIVSMFCLAMAVGYAYLFFRKQYFWNVIATVMLSVFIALLPMVLAFAGGTPLQDSLNWGMSVIKASQGQGEEDSELPDAFTAGEGEVQVTEHLTPREQLERLRWFPDETARELLHMVIDPPRSEFARWIAKGFLALIGLGAALFLLRRRQYGAMLISAGLYLVFLGLLQSAAFYGLPALMVSNRASIYFAYSLPLLLCFGIDGILTLLFLPFRRRRLMHLLSLACVVLVVWHTFYSGRIRSPWMGEPLERNAAIACMENIVATEKDFTWTIVSANDELQMGIEYGYHYETITFLQDMEGVEDWSEIQVRIPTPVVYIFIEKIPVSYFEDYPELGQAVSEKGANQPLPGGGGISMYKGERRWILMSRMYYWAQEFQRLYPNEMEVYLETEDFVCYRIEQNIFRLYDFGIDYGYNTRDYTLDEGGGA